MALPEKEFGFEKDGHTYKLTVLVRDMDALQAFFQTEKLAETEGDEAFSILIEKGKDLFKEISLTKDNKPHNGPKGEDAYQKFHDNGQLEHSLPYQDGMRQGKMRQYNEQGILVHQINFKDNGPHDEADGTQAVQIFDEKTGQRVYAEHHPNGQMNDTLSGAPARQWFENGQLVDASSYKDGNDTRKSGKDVIAAYQKSLEQFQQAVPAAKDTEAKAKTPIPPQT